MEQGRLLHSLWRWYPVFVSFKKICQKDGLSKTYWNLQADSILFIKFFYIVLGNPWKLKISKKSEKKSKRGRGGQELYSTL